MISRLSGLRVLVVEDDHDLGWLTRTALEDEGARVLLVHSGQEALMALDSFHPDLLLLDARLPDMADASRWRRFREEGRCIPVLVSGDEKAVQRWRGEGRVALRKPFHLDDLIDLLHRTAASSAGASREGAG